MLFLKSTATTKAPGIYEVDIAAKPPRHYPTAAAKCADLCVHVAGLTLALVGGSVLLGLAIERGTPGRVASVTITHWCSDTPACLPATPWWRPA